MSQKQGIEQIEKQYDLNAMAQQHGPVLMVVSMGGKSVITAPGMEKMWQLLDTGLQMLTEPDKMHTFPGAFTTTVADFPRECTTEARNKLHEGLDKLRAALVGFDPERQYLIVNPGPFDFEFAVRTRTRVRGRVRDEEDAMFEAAWQRLTPEKRETLTKLFRAK